MAAAGVALAAVAAGLVLTRGSSTTGLPPGPRRTPPPASRPPAVVAPPRPAAPAGQALVEARAPDGQALALAGLVSLTSVTRHGSRLVLGGLSVLDGAVTAGRVVVPAHGFAGAGVSDLRVDGRPRRAGVNAVFPLRAGGYVVTLQEAVAGGGRGLVGLRIHVSRPIPGSPKGGDIAVGATGGSVTIAGDEATDVLALGGGRMPSPAPGYTYPLAIRGVVIGCPFAPGSEDSPARPPANLATDNGVDLAVPVGTPVLAVADGVIGSLIGSQHRADPRYAGLRLHLNTPGRRFYYAHLSRIDVRAGQHVRRGDRLGLSGAAKGVPHVHFAQDAGNPAATIGEPDACPAYRLLPEPWN